MAPALVVNSYVRNAPAVQRLLASLRACPEFPDTDVLVVVGGHDGADYDFTTDANVTTVRAPHNSIDFTAMIAMLDRPELARDQFFYMHDTCVAGPEFLARVRALDLSGAATASFPFPSMNIGLYTREALERSRDAILALKNPDVSLEAALRFKRIGVDAEDLVFRAELVGRRHAFALGDADAAETVSDVYGTGIPRRTRYFPGVDLWKSQANWGQTFGQTHELRL
jgi:hypothetical protein